MTTLSSNGMKKRKSKAQIEELTEMLYNLLAMSNQLELIVTFKKGDETINSARKDNKLDEILKIKQSLYFLLDTVNKERELSYKA